MLFCIDIGNTNIVMGVLEGDRLLDEVTPTHFDESEWEWE